MPFRERTCSALNLFAKSLARESLHTNTLNVCLMDRLLACRIPCDYKDKNLSILVEEESKRPSNLVVKFLYQGGQTDILAVDVAPVGSSEWRFMTRVHGPVWRTDRAPAGPQQFRAVVTGGYDGKWVWAEREVLPADWRPGQVYDTGVRIADVARDGCRGCAGAAAALDWK